VKTKDDKKILCFKLFDQSHPEYFEKVHEFEEFSQKMIKNSFGEIEERYIIKTLVKVGKKKIVSTLSLSDREGMRYPVLIGRRLLAGKFIVDVNQVHTQGISIRKALKLYK
jgi:hypothetical protein